MRYTKAQLEEIVYTQLENLDAMNDLLVLMKTQNELISKINKKLRTEVEGLREKQYPKSTSLRQREMAKATD